jgi:nucleoside 2-deoxyribosyltransferase
MRGDRDDEKAVRMTTIKKTTRRSIFDHFDLENIHFSGRMSDLKFLAELYDLRKLPSEDPRFDNAHDDIYQHSVNNYDYDGNWVFEDSRFQLLEGQDTIFLNFLCRIAHPLVQPDPQIAQRICLIANDWLKEDGWELYPVREMAGGKLLSFRETNAVLRPSESEVAHIWEETKLRFFISHKDQHKVQAKGLAEQLNNYGISSFVAHDSIQPMSSWKNEIEKALRTMDAFVCYITSDFYASPWTNQEVGFALARGVPVYLYSADKTDPQGFKIDTQAIKTGVAELLNCIKKDFADHAMLKQGYLDRFQAARDGSFSVAKERFVDLVGLKFNDSEIELILQAITAKKGISEPVNKLVCILLDPISSEHKNTTALRNYSLYRE